MKQKALQKNKFKNTKRLKEISEKYDNLRKDELNTETNENF